MNIQAMMKQAQKLQKDMLNAKEVIDKTDFKYENEFIEIKAKGNKTIERIKIKKIDATDIEMMEDMITVGVNDIIRQIDDMTEDKMGKYTKGMPGIF